MLQVFWTKFGQIPSEITGQRGEIGGIDLPAPVGAAHTTRSVQIKSHVPELAGNVISSAQQLAIHYDSGSDAVRHANVNEIMTCGYLAVLKP